MGDGGEGLNPSQQSLLEQQYIQFCTQLATGEYS
jgi:hypothetical protein